MLGKAKLVSGWERLRASYSFIPSLMAAGAVALSVVTGRVDTYGDGAWVRRLPLLYTGTVDGARSLLSAVAGSMIGLAGVVFSIVIVALTLASNQFGPRLLRSFMRDAGNQVVLGTFIAAFVYCVLVLRQVRDDGPGFAPFVPQVGVLTAVGLSVAGLGVLIYFIHHAAASIQTSHIISSVTDELLAEIDDSYPPAPPGGAADGDGSGDGVAPVASHDLFPPNFDAESRSVHAGEPGYVQRIEAGELLDLAEAHDLVVRVDLRPGKFAQSDDAVLRAWPAGRVTDAVRADLRRTFTVGRERSLSQDPEFAVDQLVEVAVRALSPGFNDPFTAMQCLDHLGEGVSRLAGRPMPPPHQADAAGRVRVVCAALRFEGVVDAAFNQIRQYGRDSMAVMLRLLEVLARVARRTTDPAALACLRDHAEMTRDLAFRAALGRRDRAEVEQRVAEFEAAAAVLAPGVR